MISRLLLLALAGTSALSVAVGCDTRVETGQTLIVGPDSTFVGTLAVGPDASPFPGIQVLNDATLIVQGGTIRGGSSFPTATQREAGGGFGVSIAEEGMLLVQSGLIQGGDVVFQQRSTIGTQFAGGGTALNVNESEVEIQGGTLMGGTVQEFQPGQQQSFPGGAIFSNNTHFVFRGGLISIGRIPNTLDPRGPGNAVRTFGGLNEIMGGTFVGGFVSIANRNIITGGSIDRLELSDPSAFTTTSGCTELRGGSVPRIRVRSQERLFIFATGLNVPLGELPVQSPTRVTGRFASGTALDTLIERASSQEQGPSIGKIVIAAPGAAGCPAQL